jgi:16S rRNA (cytidine1402-2'-O)-methyltransferase
VTAGDRRAEPADGRGGRLFVVATPIGNLGDVTLRGIEVLGTVAVIAAEDTRLTRRLLDRHAIATPMVSYHARSGPGRARELIDRLRAGEDVALVTDAGTPGVSDPGEELVGAWAAEGGTVVPIPGASAVLAAIAASGVAGPRWAFEGFLPRSGGERRDRLARIGADPRGTVLYEAPGRVAATLRDLAAACGGERVGAICRELTKVHEEIVRGTLAGLSELVATGGLTIRGEFTLVVGASASQPRADDAAIAAAQAEVERRVGRGISRAEAARQVAAETGLPRRGLYAAPDRVRSAAR